MKTCMTLLISLVLLGASAALANRQEPSDTHTFILHFPQTIDTSSLSIYYFLTGSFGGYGGFLRRLIGQQCRCRVHSAANYTSFGKGRPTATTKRRQLDEGSDVTGPLVAS